MCGGESRWSSRWARVTASGGQCNRVPFRGCFQCHGFQCHVGGGQSPAGLIRLKLERGSIHLYSSHDLGRLACGISRGSPGLVLAQCLGLVSASRVHVLAYKDGDISIYGFIPWHGRTAYVVSGTSATLVFCFGYLSQ